MREAIEDVEIGFRQLEFAIKLLSYIELGKINPVDLDTAHLVQLGIANLHLPSVNFQTTDALVRAAQINLIIAFSATTLVLDQAFDAIGMKPDWLATDDAGKLRLLVYMVRCAYACSRRHQATDTKPPSSGPRPPPMRSKMRCRKLSQFATRALREVLWRDRKFGQVRDGLQAYR